MKRPWLAGVLGLLFGPFGTLYFGWKIFLGTIVTMFVSIIVVSLVTLTLPPEWVAVVPHLFFSVYLFILAKQYNEDATEVPAINMLAMGSFYPSILAIILGLSSAFKTAAGSHWIRAILQVFIGIPISIYLMHLILSFLLMIPMFAMAAFDKR